MHQVNKVFAVSTIIGVMNLWRFSLFLEFFFFYGRSQDASLEPEENLGPDRCIFLNVTTDWFYQTDRIGKKKMTEKMHINFHEIFLREKSWFMDSREASRLSEKDLNSEIHVPGSGEAPRQVHCIWRGFSVGKALPRVSFTGTALPRLLLVRGPWKSPVMKERPFGAAVTVCISHRN